MHKIKHKALEMKLRAVIARIRLETGIQSDVHACGCAECVSYAEGIQVDNNIAENAMRGIAIGRKN